jgi:hypothetical protein
MGIAERIYEVVKGLPEAAAADVLGYAENERMKAVAKGTQGDRRSLALAVLDTHAGRFKMVKFSRADLYDRACLR